MKKTEFYRLAGAFWRLKGHIFDYWMNWREKQYKDKRIFLYDKFNIDYIDKTVEISYKNPDTGEDAIDIIPISHFLYDKEPEPVITMLWYSNYHDGPLSGLAEYSGEKYWFDMVQNDHDTLFHIRTFGLYKLSLEELETEEKRHQLFRDMVGHHCDYGDNYAPYKGKDTITGFYEISETWEDRDYTKNECMGVFDECLLLEISCKITPPRV